MDKTPIMQVESKPSIETFRPQSRLSSWDVGCGIAPQIACAPLVIGQAISMWREPHTKIGLLLWLVVAVIVGIRARGNASRHLARFILALCLQCVSLGLLIYGMLYWSFELASLAAAGFLAAWSVVRFERLRWHEPVTWALLLATTILAGLVSFDSDQWISNYAGQWASTIFDVHKVPHYFDDGILNFGSGSFAIGSVTSAKLGLYAAVCLAMVLCWFLSRSLMHAILLLFSAAFSLWLTRLIATLVVTYGSLKHQQDWTASNWQHYLISSCAFASVIGLVFLFDWVLGKILDPIPSLSPDNFTLFATANKILTWPRAGIAVEHEPDPELEKIKQQIDAWEASWNMDSVTSSSRYVGLISIVPLIAILSVTLFTITKSGLVDETAVPPKLDMQVAKTAINQNLLVNSSPEFQLVSFKSSADPLDEASIPQDCSLSARWLYRWQGNSVSIDLIAPVKVDENPLKELQNQATEKNSVIPRKAEWPWYDCRSTNTFGGEMYLLQAFLPDSLEISELEPQLDDRLPLVARLKNDQEQQTWNYAIRVSCEPGTKLSTEEKSELDRLFEASRQMLRSKLPKGLINQSAHAIKH